MTRNDSAGVHAQPSGFDHVQQPTAAADAVLADPRTLIGWLDSAISLAEGHRVDKVSCHVYMLKLVRAALVVAPDEDDNLGEAWARAEAALPADWHIELRRELVGVGSEARARINGVWMLANGPVPEVVATGATPALALRALAFALRRRHA